MTSSQSAVKPAPQTPYNAPDTVPIAYRIGDFTSFRAALLDRLVALDLLPNDRPNPFAGWRDRGGSDYATIFMELWAYVGDVLTFYQQRTANEAFIQTATQRDSVLRLARLVEYAARPGAAANATVAFSAASGTTVNLPDGFALATQPPPGQEPQTFETSAATLVYGDASAIALATTAPRTASEGTTRTIVLAGISTRLRTGDAIVIAQSGKSALAGRVTSVVEDDAYQTTTITWTDDAAKPYDDTPDNPLRIFALRISATAFGSTAPSWYALPPSLTQTSSPPGPYAGTNWDELGAKPEVNRWPFLPLPTDKAQRLFLDDVYDVRAGMWLVLFGTDPSGNAMHDVFAIKDALAVAVSAYAIAGKSTAVVLDPPLDYHSGYPLRETTVLTGSELLPRAETVPLPPFVVHGEQTLILSGAHPELRAGRTIVVQGTSASSALEANVAEQAQIAATPVIGDGVTTTIQLLAPLQNDYVRARTNVLGNVTSATQGATVADEVLGSGDASAFQRYTLQDPPLTYLASSDPEGLAALKSTLAVIVNGVAWQEVRSLYGASPDAQAYTVAQDANERTTVSFGDGISGARPPTGVDNVHARYRFGLGTSGNVDAGAIAQLAGSAPGLEGVTNPFPAFGGVDAETTDEVRRNAPVQASTFGRATTARDVEALALAYPGVAKATATLQRLLGEHGKLLLQRAVYLTVAGSDPRPSAEFDQLAASLHTYLNARRDPRLPIQIANFVPVYVAFAVTVEVGAAYPHQATIDAVTTALAPGGSGTGFFAFEKRTFGEAISLATIYELLQAVRGVANARITRFACIPGAGHPYPDAVHETLYAGRLQLFVVLNDPARPEFGSVLVTGQGGYADT